MDREKDGSSRANEYRPNVGIAVFNNAGQVLLAQRADSPGSWQMPQGGIDTGEEPWPAALRELKEEIGTDNVELLGQADGWISYDFPQWVFDKYPNSYKGQNQMWFAVRFRGHDSDIDLTSTTPREFESWRWGNLAEATELVVEFKRESYREMARQFAKFAVAP